MIKSFIKKTFVNDIYILLRKYKFKANWRKNNKHNTTTPNTVFDPNYVSIGKATYGDLNIIQFASIHHLRIGNFVSIAQDVSFILDAEHYTNHLSTFPFKVKYLEIEKEESFGKGDIIIDDDVWIGYRSIIMSGVHIGQGAIIAAGSIVTKDIPPYAVVGGIPAKIIKYRFSSDICEALLKFDFSKLNKSNVNKNIEKLYTEINSKGDVDNIISSIFL